MLGLRNPFAKRPSPLEAAEAEALAKVNTQRISKVRGAKADLAARKTINGLLADIDPTKAASIRDRLLQAQALALSGEGYR